MSLIVGFELTEKAVRAAFVQTSFRGANVLRYAEAPLVQASSEEEQLSILRTAVQEVLREGERVPDRSIAALPGRQASLRVIKLPVAIKKRIAEVLPFELESLLPFELEDAIIDYQLIAEGTEELELLAAAVQGEVVGKHLEELASVGIDPVELAVGAEAFDGLMAVIPEAFEGRSVVLVDIGATTTDVCQLVDGRCAFARTITGGIDLVESGRRQHLGTTLAQTIKSLRAQREDAASVAYLLGEAATMPGALEWLSQQLEVECQLPPLPDLPSLDAAPPARFGRALALAARPSLREKRIDLRKGIYASRARAGLLLRYGKLAAVCALAITLCAGFALFSRYRIAKAEQDRLQSELQTLSQDLFGVSASDAAHAQELLSGPPLAQDPLPRFDAYDALEALSARIPSEVRHDTRSLLIEIDDEEQKGRLEIQGIVDSIAQRDQLVDALSKHECFSEIEKGSTSPAAEDRKNYRLEVTLQCASEDDAKPKDANDG